MNFQHTLIPVIEVYSFKLTEKDNLLIGFFYLDSVQKTLKKQRLISLLRGTKVSEIEELVELITSLIRFVVLIDENEFKVFEEESLRTFLTYEQSLQLITSPVIEALSTVLTKQQYFAILDQNLINYLLFLKEQAGSKQTNKTLQTFEPMLKVDAYQEAKKLKQLREEDEEEEETQTVSTSSILTPRTIKRTEKNSSDSWELLLREEWLMDFPLFIENTEMLDIQLTMRSFISDFGFPVELMKEFWQNYRQQQSLLSFTNLTIQSQSLLRTLYG